LKNNLRVVLVGAVALGALLVASPAANALANTGQLISITPVGGTGDSVTGTCTGTPAGGSFGTTQYVVQVSATASSTSGDAGLATGVTCRVWDVAHSVWLSGPVSASEPGPQAAGVGTVTIDTTNTDPLACVYANALFTGNHPAANRTGSPCPTHA
jgi:hypothetical protein